jgi:gamma-glutamyltranspeptidase/glutathione hydrolase/leukotriene-C4 hydrolase
MSRLFDNHTVWSSPPPASGAVTAAILGIMSQFILKPEDASNAVTYHRLVEAMKYGFAKRTDMGDWSDETIREGIEKVNT